MTQKSIDEIAAIIEADAGQPIERLRESLKEVEDGIPNDRVTIAEQIAIRLARKETGLSQAKFAELIETPVRTLQEWEQGRDKPIGAVLKLCKIIIADTKVLEIA